MKRSWAALVCAALLAVGGAALHAESSTSISLEPSEMEDGETKTFTDDGKTITVRREGNTTHVSIDKADKIDRLTITREGGWLRIRHGENGSRTFVVGPDFDRMPRFRTIPRETSTLFVCPKDKATLRVPDAKDDQSFKCPVDGTTMEKRKGHGFTMFFDEGTFGSNLL